MSAAPDLSVVVALISGRVDDLRTCLALEAEGMVGSVRTEDHKEAVRAFIEKRAPQFEGR